MVIFDGGLLSSSMVVVITESSQTTGNQCMDLEARAETNKKKKTEKINLIAFFLGSLISLLSYILQNHLAWSKVSWALCHQPLIN